MNTRQKPSQNDRTRSSIRRMNLSRAVVPVAVIAATLVPSAAHAAKTDKVTDAEVAQLAVGQTRWHVTEVTGVKGVQVWAHDGRQQKTYPATHGRTLRINYNFDAETGRWVLNNAFWYTDAGPVGVVGS